MSIRFMLILSLVGYIYFGLGFTSFNQIESFVVEKIKIAESFILQQLEQFSVGKN